VTAAPAARRANSERRVRVHALELLDGRDDVEHARADDASGVVEGHAVGGARAAVVTDDGEALVAGARHDVDELGGDLALAVALAERAAGHGGARSAALEVAGHDRVIAAERRRDPVPAGVILREAVQQQDGAARAGDGGGVARAAGLDGPGGEARKAGGAHATYETRIAASRHPARGPKRLLQLREGSHGSAWALNAVEWQVLRP
jgi:hypothetical protein